MLDDETVQRVREQCERELEPIIAQVFNSGIMLGFIIAIEAIRRNDLGDQEMLDEMSNFKYDLELEIEKNGGMFEHRQYTEGDQNDVT